MPPAYQNPPWGSEVVSAQLLLLVAALDSSQVVSPGERQSLNHPFPEKNDRLPPLTAEAVLLANTSPSG